MKNFDSQIFKTRDATSYDSVTEQFDYFTEQLSQPLALRMVSMAEIAPTENVLDIGTGTGVVALQAARMIDLNGMVYGIDLSEGMLAKAEEKARRMELDQKVKFSQMDAEALNFEDQKFDVALSLFALLHFPNPLIALKEIYRVTRPGGRLVLAIGSGIPIFSSTGWIHLLKRFPDLIRDLQGKRLVAPHFLDSLVQQHIPETEEPEESHLASHSHNRTQSIRSLVQQAGFDILKTYWHGHQAVIETPEEFWEIQRTFSSIARKRLSTATPDEVKSLYQKFLEKCRAVQSRGGRLVYPFAAFYVVGHRPKAD
ncbi:MAG: methyltransferase domain-containing protein [Acidobacteria bacterium]|nr:methyltransferase domain-containing protein [Acidobacteriota bacterium]